MAEIFGTTSDELIGLESESVKLMTLDNGIALGRLSRRNIILTIACAVLAVAIIITTVVLSLELNRQKLVNMQNSFTVQRAPNDIISKDVDPEISTFDLKKLADWLLLFGTRMGGGECLFVAEHGVPGDIIIAIDGNGNIESLDMPYILVKGNDDSERVYSVTYIRNKIVFIVLKYDNASRVDMDNAVRLCDVYGCFSEAVSAFDGAEEKEFRFQLTDAK